MAKKQDNWSEKHKTPIALTMVGVFIVVLMGFNYISNLPPSTQLTTAPTTNQAVAQDDAEKAAQKVVADKLVVNNTINKKVNGQYRYFFDIKNSNTAPVTATVTVTLVSKDDSFKMGTDFKLDNLGPELHETGFRELNTGYTDEFGSSGIGKFRYTVKIGNNSFEYPGQPITSKSESL